MLAHLWIYTIIIGLPMFDYVFSASHTIYKVLKHTKITSANDGIIPVVWSEHCIECAALLRYVPEVFGASRWALCESEEWD